MFRLSSKFAGAVLALAMAVPALSHAEGKGNQIAFRGAYSMLTSSRGNEVFTDTLSAAGSNDGKGGYSVATSVNLKMADIDFLWDAALLGEVFMEYSRFSGQTVRQTTSALLGGTSNSRVTVSELNVAVSPRIRFDSLGRVRPFVSPIGVAFLVNSPPSDDSGYLDLGLQFGGGVDVLAMDWLSVGIDARYTHGFGQSDTHTRYFSTGGYVGVNF